MPERASVKVSGQIDTAGELGPDISNASYLADTGVISRAPLRKHFDKRGA